MRGSGILLPVSCLPSEYGIGSFSKEAYQFIDLLKKAGQMYWQILPMGPTGYGDSPYQSFSTFAGNPYYIDLEQLIQKGWINVEDCLKYDFGKSKNKVDYEKLYHSRYEVLYKAYYNSNVQKDEEFIRFCNEEAWWLDDYSLYMVIKENHKGASWDVWEDELKYRNPEKLKRYEEKYCDRILFYKFMQFIFYQQWYELKKYAKDNGISIIGDIPIYVAFDSADSWASPELFQFDSERNPVSVAGCPPDGFSRTGQLWGNPLYDWDYHRNTGYEWWLKRIGHCSKMYDIVRIDHFRGFDEYYAIPFGDKTAEFGHWEKGPGLDLFRTVNSKLNNIRIIAEDLGFLTDSVIEMVEKSGYPGMKVLEFAFDSREPSNYLPHNYTKNSVVYTGTHDNETLLGWYRNLNSDDKKYLLQYLGIRSRNTKKILWNIIRLAQASVSDICIIPMQDYLMLGNEARINHPSTLGGNWQWRMESMKIKNQLVDKIYEITKIYGRMEKEKEK